MKILLMSLLIGVAICFVFSQICKHQWEKVSETTLPSAYEQINDNDMKIKSIEGSPSIYIFQKKYVCILKCTKCGQLKEFAHKNP